MRVVHEGGAAVLLQQACACGPSALARGFKVLLSSWLTAGVDSSLEYSLHTRVFTFIRNLSPGNGR